MSPTHSSSGSVNLTQDRPAGQAERQMGRDLLRLNSMVAGGRVVHRDPVGALVGLRSLLKTARKRHARWHPDPAALAQLVEAPSSNDGQSRFDSEERHL